MDYIQRFLAYAQDFERTYKDDDWQRLKQYFADDAVYEVQNAPIACRIQGRDAILAGIRKSLDGFDRKFDVRRIEVTTAPELLDDGLTVGWAGTYEKEGIPSMTMTAHTDVHYDGDLIKYMTDVYDAPAPATVKWFMAHGRKFDGSYT
jgi:hypothetical protein